MCRRAVAAAIGAGILLVSPTAFAYRPFDGTDADVAEVGEFELELGPAHFYGQGQDHFLIAPATVLNLGLVDRLELVVDARQFFALDQRAWQVLDTDVLLKWVVREGILQGKSGLSVALEGGPLLPELHGETQVGAQLDTIISHRWSSGTVHFNEQVALTRLGNPAVFSSVILEGPFEREARPVMELLVQKALGEELVMSALVGGIWRASDSFAFDAGLRFGRVNEERMAEVRLGFTWGVAVWKPAH
jgi:hypothetical protein